VVQGAQPPQDKVHRPRRPDVLRPREALFEEAEQDGLRLAPSLLMRDGQAAHRVQSHQGDHRIDSEHPANPPVLQVQGHQDAHQQEQVPDQADDEL